MVSLKQQRFNNVYKDISSDEEDSDYEMSDYPTSNKNQIIKDAGTNGKYSENKQYQSNVIKKKANLCLKYSSSDYGNGRRPKVFNRNALMARENRIKKKMYVQNLEESVESLKDENKKLSSILDNQSTVISDLRKEVKYLKNVLANSTDISKLLKSINENTGMPVATSINRNIKFSATEEISNFHPWAENKQTEFNSLDGFNYDDSNGEFSTLINSDFENDWNGLFSGLYPPEFINKDSKRTDDVSAPPSELTEHNYTNNSCITDNEDSGVCLHIAGHKVSLEFCVSCSENAATVWNKD